MAAKTRDTLLICRFAKFAYPTKQFLKPRQFKSLRRTLRNDRFRMELHSYHRQRFALDGLHRAVGSVGAHAETRRNPFHRLMVGLPLLPLNASGMCWCSDPPKHTFITCSPRQIPSTGILRFAA